MDSNVTDLAERFLDMLRGGRTPKHTIDDADYAEMMMRMVRAWERRVIENPEMLPLNEAILARLAEVTNVAIAANAERYAVDKRRGVSMTECARILDISKPSASARRARGVAIMADRIDRAGAARFAEAKREREQLAAAAAADHVVTALDAYRARRAS